MATLEELLALLPDNNTGAIDAADLRAVVTGLWEQGAGAVADGVIAVQSAKDYAIATNARIDAVETAEGSGTRRSAAGAWTFRTEGGSPSDGEFHANDQDVLGSTILTFDADDANDIDFTNVMPLADTIRIQDRDTAERWAAFTVNSATHNGGDFLFNVTPAGDGGLDIQNNTRCVVMFEWTAP